MSQKREEIELRLQELEARVKRLEDALLPRHFHCPKCKALIGRFSEVCGSCGKVLRAPPNPKAGQPR